MNTAFLRTSAADKKTAYLSLPEPGGAAKCSERSARSFRLWRHSLAFRVRATETVHHAMPPSSQLWEQIRERPGMYLGSASISALRQFLGGWSMALQRHDIKDDSLHLPMDFHEWVAYREHFYESTSGWSRMLLDRCGNEEAALQRFFALHDEYVARVPCEFAHVEGLSRYTEHEVDGEWTRSTHTGRLSLITYTDDPGFFAHFDAPDWGLRDEFHPDLSHWLTFAGTGSHSLTISDHSEYDRVMEELAK